MPNDPVAHQLTPEQARLTADLAADIAARLGAARARLTRLARLRGVPADQTDDVVQETLLTAWRSLDRLRDPQRFDAWLDGILRNHCRRHAAAWDEQAAPLSALEGFDAPAEEADPLEELSQQELTTLVDAALGHLRAGARQALELRYLAELPSEEVAARLGLTLNALDLRLSRARRQLREILSGPLRERAVEFGLALAPADESGWRDSSLWCHFCGRARLQGILEDAPAGVGGRLVLRCPRCYQETGAAETDVDSLAAIQGLSSFRSASKRLMRLGFERIPASLLRDAPCYLCGTPLRARVVSGRQIAVLDALVGRYPNHFYIILDCRVCGSHVHGAALIAGRAAPEVMSFILERQRFVVEPEELTAYDSAPAIRFSLYDLAAGERVIYFADPETLDLRGVHSA